MTRRGPKRRHRVRRLLRRLAVILVAMILATTGGAWLWWLPDPPASAKSQGINGLWARHQWVGEAHAEADYDDLAVRLREGEISDVFFHAGPFDGDGTVPPEKYTNAKTLVDEMHARLPDLRVQAYLGQVEKRGGGPLDIDDPQTRQNILATVDTFLDLGFDGIHYDIEPVYPDDEAFLDLLARTHERTMAEGAVLSTAIEQLEMIPGLQQTVTKVVERYHDPTREYLRKVARRVDQVAIMTYDTALLADFLFGAHMAWQTEHVVNHVHEATDGRTTVFLGVTTYDYDNAGFHPRAENVKSGVRGVRKGLARLSKDKKDNVGIALYPEWTMSPQDWSDYVEGWVR